MKFPEPAVFLDQHQMDVVERVANAVGHTGEELVRAAIKRVMDSLEDAQRAAELSPELGASTLQAVHGSTAPPSNVFHLSPRR